jgi:hypothetical protein
MNKKCFLVLIVLLISMFLSSGITSQEDELLDNCLTSYGSPFIVTDQSLKTFLTGSEVAEFRATFFKGTVYRVVSCGFESDLIEFSLLDTERNILFSSADHANANIWDFQMEGSIECIIEAKLNPEKTTSSGMVFMILGFKSSHPDAY